MLDNNLFSLKSYPIIARIFAKIGLKMNISVKKSCANLICKLCC